MNEKISNMLFSTELMEVVRKTFYTVFTANEDVLYIGYNRRKDTYLAGFASAEVQVMCTLLLEFSIDDNLYIKTIEDRVIGEVISMNNIKEFVDTRNFMTLFCRDKDDAFVVYSICENTHDVMGMYGSISM